VAAAILLLFEHDFCGLDYGGNSVAYFEFHFLRATAGNDALDKIGTNLDDDVSHDSAKLEFSDFSFKSIAG
jgi:hypothetical protein